MALYEIVLRFEDRDEVRVTDTPPEVGETLSINGSRWRVESLEDQGQNAQYICVSYAPSPAA